VIVIAFEFHILFNYVCLAYLCMLRHQKMYWIVTESEDLLIFFLKQKY